MRILVIDGQGGNIGKQLVKMLQTEIPECDITAVGTNSIATSNMLKGAPVAGATGENAVIVGCRKADVIVGPLGIVIADALMGEVTEKMAAAVARSEAVKILIPMNRCENLVAGIGSIPVSALIEDAVRKVKELN